MTSSKQISQIDTSDFPFFRYVTQSSRGGRYVWQNVQAANRESAEKDLLSRQIPVLHMEPAVKAKTANQKKMSDFEKLLFFQQIQTGQIGGMPMIRALNIAMEASPNQKVKRLLAMMKEEIEGGNSLASAMSKSGQFSSMQIGIIKAGEETSTLALACEQLCDLLDRSLSVFKKLKTIMIYPVMVSLSALACIYMVVSKVIPQLAPIFAAAGAELPLPTRIVKGASDYATEYPIPFLLCFVGIGVFFFSIPKIYLKFPVLHGLALKSPALGPFLKNLIVETFARTFLNLSKSGVQTIHCLYLLREISTNYEYKAAVARCIVLLGHGVSLGDAMRHERHIFGYYLPGQILFGEQAGKMAASIEPLSAQLSKNVVAAIEQFKEILTPMITWFIAIIVFVIIAAAFLPTFMAPNLFQ